MYLTGTVVDLGDWIRNVRGEIRMEPRNLETIFTDVNKETSKGNCLGVWCAKMMRILINKSSSLSLIWVFPLTSLASTTCYIQQLLNECYLWISPTAIIHGWQIHFLLSSVKF